MEPDRPCVGTLVRRDQLSRRDAKLVDEAEQAAKEAQPQFSGIMVGAALRVYGGTKIHLGWNVEDQSLTRVLHAEQAAIYSASLINGADVRIKEIAIWGEGDAPPCGACRQMIGDSNPEGRVLFPHRGQILIASAKQLLPLPFTIRQRLNI